MKKLKAYTKSIIINDENREAVVDWLNDRKFFHVWLASLVLSSFVLLTIFGEKPGLSSPKEIWLASALLLHLLCLLTNLVSIWSLPDWVFGVKTKIITSSNEFRIQLGVVSWLGVTLFSCGLCLSLVANLGQT